MPTVTVNVETPVSRSARARQLESMFDVPPSQQQRRSWAMDVPLDARPWHVGLVVGPSRAGKTKCATSLWPTEIAYAPTWGAASVVDDFGAASNIQEIADVCMAVGFNTVPAWLRPYAVLSNGEKFRVELARRLLEGGPLLVCDEFTSVVDRQVAQIGAHAVQKFVRKHDRRFVAVTCHEDVEPWLNPDWVLEPATGAFRWRALQPRPPLDVVIGGVPYAAWRVFAPFHYLTAHLHRAARCFALSVNGRLAAFAGMMHRPASHAGQRPIMGCSRLVTLPDFQGLGLAFVLIDHVAAMFRAIGVRVRTYPAHPALMRAFDRSPVWKLVQRPGAQQVHSTQELQRRSSLNLTTSWMRSAGSRPNAVFEYVGPASPSRVARDVLAYWPDAAWRKGASFAKMMTGADAGDARPSTE